ncbi:matrixin family metalloprotease [Brevibacillus fortis]|uniref:Peptidase metallopeptidase domain-containing protein n=1 Tax=Brevibacillus fortis TaxID=2126352 RepID=A0A2P7UEP9_9BACL|nr:matrixin family metalloprotease [Brevibacillus fortis]PSJ85457.1 hypothetical protein C7R93_29800 [Brevibacillus fortis]
MFELYKTGLFTVVASLSFFTTSAFADYLGGKWDVSNILYEDINLKSKYSRVLWTAVDKWNGISPNMDLSPVDTDETGYVSVKHPSKKSEDYMKSAQIYGLGVPYDEFGREGRSPYASAEVIISASMCDSLDEDDRINTIAHEFGHILGLAHTSDTSEDSIMDNNDVFDWDIDGPTRYDKRNIKDLYND